MDNNTTSNKRLTNGFSIRLDNDFRRRLEVVAARQTTPTGRPLPLSEVILSAIEYGLPMVERDHLHRNVMPKNALTKTEKFLVFCQDVVASAAEHGIELPPNESSSN